MKCPSFCNNLALVNRSSNSSEGASKNIYMQAMTQPEQLNEPVHNVYGHKSADQVTPPLGTRGT